MRKVSFLLFFLALIAWGCSQPGDPNPSRQDQNQDHDQDDKNNDDDNQINNDSYLVRDLKASCMEVASQIRLSWTEVKGADSYKVYCFSSTEQPLADARQSTTFNHHYTDQQAIVNTPYFYKIACIKNGKQYDLSQQFIPGIFGQMAEINEPLNNARENIAGPEVGTFPIYESGFEDLLFYSFEDENGQVVKDVDWYKYRGVLNDVTRYFVLKVKSSSALNKGDLRCTYYAADGAPGAEYEIDPRPYITLEIPFYDSGDGVQEVYFKIDSTRADLNQVIQYQVKLTRSP